MGHEERRAREGLDRLLEHLKRRNIEVVRRLVEHEHVGRLEHHARDMRARKLSARQHRHLLQQLLVAEQEPPRPALDVHLSAAEANLVARRGDRVLEERALREFGARLRHRHDARLRVGGAHMACVPREFARQDAQKRRLARAVRTHEPDALAGRDIEVEVPEEQLSAERLRDSLGREQEPRLASARAEVDAGAACVCGGVARRKLGELVAALGAVGDAGLALGASRFGAAAKPAVVLAHGVRQRLLGLRLHREKLRLATAELGVVSIDRERALGVGARELDDARRTILEEHAVVRHEDNRARAEIVASTQEEVLEPVESLDIEVVRRLVEIEEVGRAAGRRKRAGDGEALLPAARERAGDRVHARVVETDLAEDDRREDFGLMLIAVGLCAGKRRGGRGRDRGDALAELVALRDIDGDGAARRANLARVRILAAGEHAQQRRLASAVRADHADPLAFIDRDRDAAEEFAQAV